MSVRRQSRSRSRRGRRRHSRPKTDRSRPRKERKRKREESSRGRDSDRTKKRLSRKSVSSKPSKPKEPSVASDVASEIASEDDNAMNSEEEQAWLEKRRLLRIEIQKKHQANSCRSPSTKSTPSNPPPSTGQLRTTSAERSLPTNPSGIAPGTPFQFEPGADGDVADIFGLVSTEPERSPQPESPVTAQPSCGSSNEGDRRDEESLEKIDASEVLKKLGADDSEDGRL